MAKKQDSDFVAEIRKSIEKNKLTMGRDETVKNIKRGNITKVYMTNNIDTKLKEDLEYYSENFGIEIVSLDIDQAQLGVVCKKPFPISVIGFLK